MEEKKVNIIPKGILKQLVLGIINEKPLHGYGIISKIKEETGFWKPSPGTMYPILRSMLEEGLIKEISAEKESKRKYSITEKGKKSVKSVNSLKEKIREQLIEFYSKVSEKNKEEIKRKIHEWINNPKLKKTMRTFGSLMIEIGKDEKKMEKAIKLLNKTNEELAKISND